MTHVLETTRLRLREMTIDDLDVIAAMLADPEVMQYFGRCYTREEAQQWIERQQTRYTRDGYGYWLAHDHSGTPVGQIGLMRVDDPRLEAPAIGYIVRREAWRRGYATEGGIACRDHAFGALDAAEVISLIRPENTPSVGVARKIGLAAAERLEYAGYEHIVFRARRPGGPR